MKRVFNRLNHHLSGISTREYMKRAKYGTFLRDTIMALQRSIGPSTGLKREMISFSMKDDVITENM